jgi:hypothetical protein
VAVAGRLAGYAVERCGVDTGTTLVEVRRLSDDRQLFTRAASSLSLGPESYDSVSSIVVAPSGEVAWIAVASSLATHRQGSQVLEADRSGRRVLETGASIQANSLRLHGSRLTWSAGGVKHSAKLG